MAGAALRAGLFHDLAHLGLRLVIGTFFIVHSQLKFGPGFGKFLTGIGLPNDMALLVGLLEVVGGSLLIVGVLSRISATLIAVDMLGAIFYVKKLKAFSGNQGIELELLALVILLSVAVLGPGRISLSHVVRKLPRSLH